MSCYVDELFTAESKVPAAFRVGKRSGHRWCHLWADTDTELHEFARKILLRRNWFRPHRTLNHYDLTPGKRRQAIAAGAIPVSLFDWLRRKHSKAEWRYRYEERLGILCGAAAPSPQAVAIAEQEANQWQDAQNIPGMTEQTELVL